MKRMFLILASALLLLLSGTVAAALEGYMIDIPSVAFSKDTFETDHMEDAAAASAVAFWELTR